VGNKKKWENERFITIDLGKKKTLKRRSARAGGGIGVRNSQGGGRQKKKCSNGKGRRQYSRTERCRKKKIKSNRARPSQTTRE